MKDGKIFNDPCRLVGPRVLPPDWTTGEPGTDHNLVESESKGLTFYQN